MKTCDTAFSFVTDEGSLDHGLKLVKIKKLLEDQKYCPILEEFWAPNPIDAPVLLKSGSRNDNADAKLTINLDKGPEEAEFEFVAQYASIELKRMMDINRLMSKFNPIRYPGIITHKNLYSIKAIHNYL